MRLPFFFSLCVLSTAQAQTVDQVKTSLVKAVQTLHTKAAKHGGYVYKYSADYQLREAEGIPEPDTIWIQPPGTPAVGEAMLDAYLATQDETCLKAATDAAHALSRTQLVCGGWDYTGHFHAEERKKHYYLRTATGELANYEKVPTTADPGWHVWAHHSSKIRNRATLDDDVTQAATRLLIRVNHTLKGADAEIKVATELAVQTLIRTQYPCGAWSAYFEHSSPTPPSAKRYPVLKANYPKDWPRQWPKDFTGCYVLNDNLHATATRTLLLAAELNNDSTAKAAACRAGDFLLHAQMPDPQPAWAQQYDTAMQPVWSRAFEPTAISGRESQSAMWALLRLADVTGDKKYLAPLPRALTYLKKLLLPSGEIARFYELQSNHPLYFQRGPEGKGFVMSYESKNASSNYGWEGKSEIDDLQAAHDAVLAGTPVKYPTSERALAKFSVKDKDVMKLLKAQDSTGMWIDKELTIRNAEGKKTSPPGGVIRSEIFVKNVRLLCAWLTGKKQSK